MKDLHRYLEKTSLFLEDTFECLKLNIEYSFNFVKISEEDASLEFYREVEYSHPHFNFFDFTRRYISVNNIPSRTEAYIFSLNKIYSQNKNKVFIFKVDDSESLETSFFILQVDLEAYKRHINYDFNCNFLDFLFD